MTEIAVPLTVRRSVAFSRAVYEEEAQVEDAWAVLVQDLSLIHIWNDSLFMLFHKPGNYRRLSSCSHDRENPGLFPI